MLALARRAEWRGFSVRVDAVTRGEPLPPDADVVFMGGGTDRVQEIIGADLRSPPLGAPGRRGGRGAVVVGVCGGYQFLGHRYVDADGVAIEGLGLLDVETVAGIGPDHRQRAGARLARRTRLRPDRLREPRRPHDARPGGAPLATVPPGQGNNGLDGTEGAVQGRVIGSYLHGPVLPVNPGLADAILTMALSGRLTEERLEPLDDRLEAAAHAAALDRRR